MPEEDITHGAIEAAVFFLEDPMLLASFVCRAAQFTLTKQTVHCPNDVRGFPRMDSACCGVRIHRYSWVPVARGGVRSFSFRRMVWLRSRRANLALRSRLKRALSPLRADMVPQEYQK